MGAPKGNQFWKLRAKHGRDKLFSSPELLWDAACEYFEWCDNHPWIKEEEHLKVAGLEMKSTPIQRPYTITGFCLYCDASETWWRDFKAANHKDFSSIIAKVETVIYTNKFEGATVGVFNANIIARDLGLSDKTENKTKLEIEPPKIEFK